jgi:hypothetical protein
MAIVIAQLNAPPDEKWGSMFASFSPIHRAVTPGGACFTDDRAPLDPPCPGPGEKITYVFDEHLPASAAGARSTVTGPDCPGATRTLLPDQDNFAGAQGVPAGDRDYRVQIEVANGGDPGGQTPPVDVRLDFGLPVTGMDLALVRLGRGAKAAAAACSWLTGPAPAFVASAPMSGLCRPQHWQPMTAAGARWRYRFNRRLPAGRYVAYARRRSGEQLLDSAFSDAQGNRKPLRIKP